MYRLFPNYGGRTAEKYEREKAMLKLDAGNDEQRSGWIIVPGEIDRRSVIAPPCPCVRLCRRRAHQHSRGARREWTTASARGMGVMSAGLRARVREHSLRYSPLHLLKRRCRHAEKSGSSD